MNQRRKVGVAMSAPGLADRPPIDDSSIKDPAMRMALRRLQSDAGHFAPAGPRRVGDKRIPDVQDFGKQQAQREQDWELLNTRLRATHGVPQDLATYDKLYHPGRPADLEQGGDSGQVPGALVSMLGAGGQQIAERVRRDYFAGMPPSVRQEYDLKQESRQLEKLQQVETKKAQIRAIAENEYLTTTSPATGLTVPKQKAQDEAFAIDLKKRAEVNVESEMSPMAAQTAADRATATTLAEKRAAEQVAAESAGAVAEREASAAGMKANATEAGQIQARWEGADKLAVAEQVITEARETGKMEAEAKWKKSGRPPTDAEVTKVRSMYDASVKLEENLQKQLDAHDKGQYRMDPNTKEILGVKPRNENWYKRDRELRAKMESAKKATAYAEGQLMGAIGGEQPDGPGRPSGPAFSSPAGSKRKQTYFDTLNTSVDESGSIVATSNKELKKQLKVLDALWDLIPENERPFEHPPHRVVEPVTAGE